MEIRVLLVDDHTIIRQGLKSLLNNESGVTVVAEAANGQEAVRMARELALDIILMDLTMPHMSGVEASRRILEENSAHRIIILTMVLDWACVREALNAGAVGYVLKDCTVDELAASIHAVMAGGTYLCREAADLVIKYHARDSSVPPGEQRPSLSVREMDMLRLIADGKNSKEIAFQLDISAKTADAQRLKIMHKLNLHSVAELTKYAVREGLTCVD